MYGWVLSKIGPDPYIYLNNVLQKCLQCFVLLQDSDGEKRPQEGIKSTRLYGCAHCLYLNEYRGVKGHVVAWHLEVQEAPYYCKLCTVKYVESGPWVNHANSNGHRAKAFFFLGLVAGALGRTFWEMKMTGERVDACASVTEESNRWELQLKMVPEGPGGDNSRDQARAEEGLSELGCRDTLMVGTGKTARVATPRVRQPYPPSMGAPQQHQTPFQMFPLLQASHPWMQRPSFSRPHHPSQSPHPWPCWGQRIAQRTWSFSQNCWTISPSH